MIAKPVIVCHEPLDGYLLSSRGGIILVIYTLIRARPNLQVSPPNCCGAVGQLEGAVKIHDWDVVGVVLVGQRAIAAVVVAADEQQLED